MPPESRALSVPPAKAIPLAVLAVDPGRVGNQRAAVDRNQSPWKLFVPESVNDHEYMVPVVRRASSRWSCWRCFRPG